MSPCNVATRQARVEHWRIDRAGKDGVDADVLRAELQRHRARECQQRAFARSICGDAAARGDGVDRADVHDRAVAIA